MKYLFNCKLYSGHTEKIEIKAKTYESALNLLYSNPNVSSANLLQTK